MDEKPTFPYKLLPELAELGSTGEVLGSLSLKELKKGPQTFELADGISYSLTLSNTGGAVLLRGYARAAGATECARCLESATFEVEGEVEGYYLLTPEKLDESLSDEEFSVVEPDGIVDLAIPIIAAIIFELPQVLLCKEDCAGLCPVCGANRNDNPCTCADNPSPLSPFAVLGELAKN
jgi:uncharacterized protein